MLTDARAHVMRIRETGWGLMPPAVRRYRRSGWSRSWRSYRRLTQMPRALPLEHGTPSATSQGRPAPTWSRGAVIVALLLSWARWWNTKHQPAAQDGRTPAEAWNGDPTPLHDVHPSISHSNQATTSSLPSPDPCLLCRPRRQENGQARCAPHPIARDAHRTRTTTTPSSSPDPALPAPAALRARSRRCLRRHDLVAS